jgi:hypothetical protein
LRINRRGSILLHVMVTGALMALIAASLLRMSMLRYQMGGRGAKILQEKRDDQSALAAVIAVWNNNATPNATCSAAPAGWGGCTSAAVPPNNCNCTCTRPDGVSVVAALNGGVCQLTIRSNDIQ